MAAYKVHVRSFTCVLKLLLLLLFLFHLVTLIQPLLSANESDLVELQHANVLGKGSQHTKAALSVWAGRNAGTRQLSKECSFGRNSRAKNEGEKMNSKFGAGLTRR